MKRVDALRAMVFAGYHGDSATWTRLYIENRVSLAVAKAEWAKGAAAKARGVLCNCNDCKPKEATAS